MLESIVQGRSGDQAILNFTQGTGYEPAMQKIWELLNDYYFSVFGDVNSFKIDVPYGHKRPELGFQYPRVNYVILNPSSDKRVREPVLGFLNIRDLKPYDQESYSLHFKMGSRNPPQSTNFVSDEAISFEDTSKFCQYVSNYEGIPFRSKAPFQTN